MESWLASSPRVAVPPELCSKSRAGVVIVAVVVCSDEAWMVVSKEHHYSQAQAYLQHSSGLEAALSICLTRLKYKGLNLKVA